VTFYGVSSIISGKTSYDSSGYLESEPGPEIPTIRLAAAKRTVGARIKERWEKQWEREDIPAYKPVGENAWKALRVYEYPPKPYAAIVIQLRSMRIRLSHYL
jgi:hypothetical protein